MIRIFSSLNSLEMPVSHYGLYRVGWPSTMWGGPGPVTHVLRTPARGQLFQRCFAKITCLRSFFSQSISSQQFRIRFCGSSIHELVMVERDDILLDTYKHHLPCIFRLSRYNEIILSIHSTLLEVAGVLQCCSGKTCGVGLIFNCIEITTS